MDILTLALLFCKGDGWQRENFNRSINWLPHSLKKYCFVFVSDLFRDAYYFVDKENQTRNLTLAQLIFLSIFSNFSKIWPQKWTVKKLSTIHSLYSSVYKWQEIFKHAGDIRDIERKSVASGGYYKDNMMDLLVFVENKSVDRCGLKISSFLSRTLLEKVTPLIHEFPGQVNRRLLRGLITNNYLSTAPMAHFKVLQAKASEIV